MPGNNVRWYVSARKQFLSALEYIRTDSVQNAEKFNNRLFLKLEAVSKNPESCAPEKFKVANDGSYRAFILYKYRVTYRVKENEIRIVRFRHSSMKPRYF